MIPEYVEHHTKEEIIGVLSHDARAINAKLVESMDKNNPTLMAHAIAKVQSLFDLIYALDKKVNGGKDIAIK